MVARNRQIKLKYFLPINKKKLLNCHIQQFFFIRKEQIPVLLNDRTHQIKNR